MSPPIYTPDGQEVTEIVLPDGSTASEVVAPDGSVVFEAGPDIPDKADLHARYDFSEEDGATPVTDQTGNGFDLSGSYSGVGVSINGVQAGDFDGVDDRVQGTLNQQIQNYTVILVIDLDSQGNFRLWHDAGQNRQQIGADSANQWFVGDAGASGRAPVSTGAQLVSGEFGASTSNLRSNGTDIVSGGGVSAFDTPMLGAKPAGNETEMAIGFAEIHDGTPSNGLATREQEIADDWGITL